MTNLEDALVAVDAGADAVGFVFYDKSSRNVSVGQAGKIVEKLPSRVEKVGVFVNETPERVGAVADQAGLSAVQLHGDEYKNPISYSRGKIFFAMPMLDILRDLRGQNAFYEIPTLPNGAGIVLDSGSSEQRGGTGKAFGWAEARPFISALEARYQVVLAGGLTPSNVSWAAEFLKPWGVDVVSGVEAAPGKKDPEKVRAFVRAVREADRKAG